MVTNQQVIDWLTKKNALLGPRITAIEPKPAGTRFRQLVKIVSERDGSDAYFDLFPETEYSFMSDQRIIRSPGSVHYACSLSPDGAELKRISEEWDTRALDNYVIANGAEFAHNYVGNLQLYRTTPYFVRHIQEREMTMRT